MRMSAFPLLILSLATVRGDEPAGPDATTPPVPVTREAMKRLLEDSKRNKPRLPLPPLTEDEIKAAKARETGPGPAGRGGLGGVINNGRMRKYYLLPEFTGAGFTREPDKGMSLGYPFQTMCFWIVSRCNNCVYCMGHQESKLAAAGVPEETIAAMDVDWSKLTDRERAAFGFVKKLTLEPQKIGDADIEALKAHFNESEILEIILVSANFNAMNRWTGALRIPQEAHREYLTPTPAQFSGKRSLTAPAVTTASAGENRFCALPANRGPLESQAEVDRAIERAGKRKPRIALVEEAEARKVLPPEAQGGDSAAPMPAYVRLLARFPKAGGARIVLHRASEEKGLVEPKLRAAIAYVAARSDRAWYALDQARRRLERLGASAGDIEALDGDLSGLSERDRAVCSLAKKLTADPALVNDADIENVRKHMSDKETAEVIHHITEAAGFDRITEAAGLPIEP